MKTSRILPITVAVLFFATVSLAQQKKQPNLIYPPGPSKDEKAKIESPKKAEDVKPANENVRQEKESIKVKPGFGVTVVQNPAEFPGGQEALVAFASKNMTYPKKAKESREEGQVCIGFKITKEGKVADVRIVSSVSEEIDAEALRAIQQMPDWRPGSIQGVPVDVQYVLPISFILPKSDLTLF